MTAAEDAVARETYDRLMSEAKSLGTAEKVILGAIARGADIGFSLLPAGIRQRLYRIGTASEVKPGKP